MQFGQFITNLNFQPEKKHTVAKMMRNATKHLSFNTAALAVKNLNRRPILQANTTESDGLVTDSDEVSSEIIEI